MKWDKLFLIKLSPDNTINESAETYREWEQVPPEQRWTNGKVEDGWQELYKDCFKKPGVLGPTLKDKVMIIAHGTRSHIGNDTDDDQATSGFMASDLAAKFVYWGIQEIGLLTFKSCLIGDGWFLDSFVNRCSVEKLKVGWVKGYKGYAHTIERTEEHVKIIGRGKPNQPYEAIMPNRRQIDLKTNPPMLEAKERYKIVPGNAAWKKPGSRYDPELKYDDD